jgi:TRAP-type C4-dicarboxylate transport system permease small subunit
MNAVQPTVLERVVAVLCKAVLWITSSVIFLILVANTLLRYAAGSSLQWANEVPELMFPWLVMAGIVLASLHGAHIATTFLMEALPAHVRRVVAVLGWLTVAGLYLTLSSATYNLLEIVHDEKSPILGVPGSMTYGCILGGMVMLALLALQSAWRCAWGVSPVAGNHGDAAGPSAAQG